MEGTLNRDQFRDLRPGERVEVEHLVTIGPRVWTTQTGGTVVRSERLRHGLHFRRNFDDKVRSDVIFLQRPDGEFTAVAMDEFTTLRKVQ
jgi:hypothetical protein